jgi:hypothetical protein
MELHLMYVKLEPSNDVCDSHGSVAEGSSLDGCDINSTRKWQPFTS